MNIINTNLNPVKAEYGCWHSTSSEENPVEYAVREITKNWFIPEDIRNLADKAVQAHIDAEQASAALHALDTRTEIVNYLFGTKMDKYHLEVRERFEKIAKKEYKIFSELKNKYMAWYQKYKDNPENGVMKNMLKSRGLEKIITAANIDKYLRSLTYDEDYYCWKVRE